MVNVLPLPSTWKVLPFMKQSHSVPEGVTVIVAVFASELPLSSGSNSKLLGFTLIEYGVIDSTVILPLADLYPYSQEVSVAVIVAVPALTPVTVPSETVAIDG